MDVRGSLRRHSAWPTACLALCAVLSISLTACTTPLKSQQSSSTAKSSFCAPPAINPTAAQAITNVVHTTTIADWPTWELAPQNALDSFALNQPWVTAVKLGTDKAGIVSVRNRFCSDGHDDPDADDWKFSVAANSAGDWMTGGLDWVYSAQRPQDTGRVMQMIYWNGALARVSFLTIQTSSETSQPCPAVPGGAYPGLTVTDVKLSATTVTEQGVSRITLYYDSTLPGDFRFFLCRDGTTIDVGNYTSGVGANYYVYAFRDMVQNPQMQCPGCILYGAARWIVTFNHIVIAQAPFTITQ